MQRITEYSMIKIDCYITHMSIQDITIYHSSHGFPHIIDICAYCIR
jgi:hypothetical protein